MCTAQTARRRRKQAANNYRHISKMRRPKYKKTTSEISQKRLSRLIEKQKLIASRKGNKKR